MLEYLKNVKDLRRTQLKIENEETDDTTTE